MDIKAVKVKIKSVIKKYKYAALVLILGIALMLLPGLSTLDKSNKEAEVHQEQYTTEIDTQLSAILSTVEGAGKVEVMLTVSKGQQTVYQTNTDQSTDEHTSDIKTETVVLTDSGRNEYGLVKRVDPVQYLGAIVICQGADSPTVRLAIIEAVSKITGLGSDRICVLKMK